jgi:hypothetical protein
MSTAKTPRQAVATRSLVGALTGCVAVWGLVLAASWSSLHAYGFKRELSTQTTPAEWPADSRMARPDGRPLLLVFLHPKCPCSHATVSELERMLSAPDLNAGEFDVAVVACTPRSTTESWTRTPLVRRAAQLPRAKVYADAGSVEAARFAATTSGEVVLVDAGGRRLYAGGVTKSRGHVGDNAGADTVARLLRGDRETTAMLPAFGCRLVRDDVLETSDCGDTAASCEGPSS